MKASSGSLTGMLVRMWEEEAETREAVRLKYHIRHEEDQPVFQYGDQVTRNSDQMSRSGDQMAKNGDQMARSSDHNGEQSPTKRGRHHHHHHHHHSRKQQHQQQTPRPEVIYEADEEFDLDEGHRQQVAVVLVSVSLGQDLFECSFQCTTKKIMVRFRYFLPLPNSSLG